MKKYSLLVVILGLSFALCGFGGSAPETPSDNNNDVSTTGPAGDTFLIDNFENSKNLTNPEWWKFDKVTLTVVDNSGYRNGDDECLKSIGNYSLNIKGTAANWYAGGLGTYMAKPKTNLSQYTKVQVDVYGNGPGSGTLQLELYDDDNGNWQVEQDPKKNYVPVADDKLMYQLSVTWKGWKRVVIPIADFEDINPSVGDDVWNPEQKGGSGGLLQIQIIAIGPSKSGKINYNVDNIMLTK